MSVLSEESLGRRTYDDRKHPGSAFFAGEECGHEEDDDGDRYRSNGEIEFHIVVINNHHDELDGKSQKEEEVELQQGNVDLK